MSTDKPQPLAILAHAPEIRAFAADLDGAGPLLPKHIQSPAQAMAIVYAGAEMGMAPMQAIRSLYLVEGRVVIDATAQLAMAIRAGVTVDWQRSDDKEAVLVLRRGTGSYTSRWSMEMAARAGLAQRGTWQKHPDAMLRARAITSGIRAFCPDVLGGAAYAPGELEEDAPARVDVTPAPAPVVIEAEVVRAPDDHDPSWPGAARAYAAELGKLGLDVYGVTAWMLAQEMPRLSQLTAEDRGRLLADLTAEPVEQGAGCLREDVLAWIAEHPDEVAVEKRRSAERAKARKGGA